MSFASQKMLNNRFNDDCVRIETINQTRRSDSVTLRVRSQINITAVRARFKNICHPFGYDKECVRKTEARSITRSQTEGSECISNARAVAPFGAI